MVDVPNSGTYVEAAANTAEMAQAIDPAQPPGGIAGGGEE